MLMLNNLTEEQRLTKAVVSIMGNPKYTALAGVLMIGERNVVDDDSVPTACTNGTWRVTSSSTSRSLTTTPQKMASQL
jgi:hypothetical protein